MDITQLKTKALHDQGSEMRVKGPDGKETDVYITLIGMDSDAWVEIMREIELLALKKEDDLPLCEIMAKCSKGWRGLTNNGEEIPFTYESAVDLYRNAPYIAKQADLHVANRRNFLPPKPKN